MPLIYKMDVLAELKKAGYNSYRLRAENLLGQSTISKLRAGEVIGIINLDVICRLLSCQPGDIIEYRQESP